MSTQTSVGRSHITELPFDTFLKVLRYAFHQWGSFAISSLSRTCKYFHFEVIKFLLGQKLTLFGESGVTSFCIFMLAERSRFAMLRGQLTFRAVSIPGATAALLVDCLRHVTDLPSLHIFYTNTFLGPHPHLLTAFARLTCLTELGLRIHDQSYGSAKGETAGPARYYVTLLKTTRSRLRSVLVEVVEMVTQKNLRYTYIRSLDPIWLLSQHADTLQSVNIDGIFTVDACTVVHQYPYVTSLTLPDENRVHHIHPFIASFPALRSLRLHGTAWYTRLQPQASVTLVTGRHGRLPIAARERNKQDQVAFGSWSTLHEVFGPTLDLYKIGFTCRIPSLHLIWMGGVPADEGMIIREVLQDTRPLTLRMITSMAHTLSPLEHAFRDAEYVWSLTRLEMKLNMDVVPFHPKAYLEGVVNAVESLPLLSVSVEIKCAMDSYASSYPLYANPAKGRPCMGRQKIGADDIPAFCNTLAKMETEDIPGHLWHFVSKITTLRQVTIAWGRCEVEVPHRVVTLDLNRVPYITDRPYDPTEDSTLWRQAF